MEHIVIIGNGISGITAARYIRKMSDRRITVISSESDHFFSRTALMYIYMGHMKYQHTKPYEDWFWSKNRIELKRARVEQVDFDSKTLKSDDGSSLDYDKLIIATGSVPNKIGWPGEDLKGVQGMYHIQDVESMEEMTPRINRAVIVGGGLIGIEMAEMLHSRNIPVSMLVREQSFWNKVLPPEESEMVNRQIQKNHIDLQLNTELEEILGDEQGRVKGVRTKAGDTIDCEFVGLTIGVKPNISFLKDTALETEKGVLVNEFLQTNIPDVYAIGDCAQFRQPKEGKPTIEQVWYTGRMQGETVAYTICKQPTVYEPGNWFNSAKFIDVEYQIYGKVSAHPEEQEEQLYWEDQSGTKSIRIAYDASSHVIMGFNLMGIRYRHEICDDWISRGAHITEVLRDLRAANFDPEFFKTYEKEIVDQFNQRYPGQAVSLRPRKSLIQKIFG